MTNTRNTPVEALEMSIPVRVERYALRRGSGGTGRHQGGMGVERVLRFLSPARVTLVAERRRLAPFGVAGGAHGAPGSHTLLRAGAPETAQPLPAKTTFEADRDDVLVLHTPGGGGWGQSQPPGESFVRRRGAEE